MRSLSSPSAPSSSTTGKCSSTFAFFEASTKLLRSVWRMSLPGQVSGHFTWRSGSRTRLDFEVDEGAGITVKQDGAVIAQRKFEKGVTLQTGAKAPFTVKTCSGIFGPCADGVKVRVSGL